MIEDLATSGLEPRDMLTRVLDSSERAACIIPAASQGYVIPYFNIIGKVLPYYRAKIFNVQNKYRQVKGTPNHVYFPRGFLQTLEKTGADFVLFTEGEKKAACATKMGFPAIAFGGVDSWRNRTILLPANTEFSAYAYSKDFTSAKLPAGGFLSIDVAVEPIAMGFEDLAMMLLRKRLTAIIVYDTDEMATLTGMKPTVQKAAAELGHELRSRGIPVTQIRQLILPNFEGAEKTGLDDFLMADPLVGGGPATLHRLIEGVMDVRCAFPRHPNMHALLQKKLAQPKISRADMQRLGLSIITDMDANGMRMIDKESGLIYYFEERSTRLMRVEMTGGQSSNSSEALFDRMMYQQYGISLSSDIRLVKWLETQYMGEDPVEQVVPYRVFARNRQAQRVCTPTGGEREKRKRLLVPTDDPDVLRMQISDGQYVKLTSNLMKPLEILNNGTENVLFEAGCVEPIEAEELQVEFDKQMNQPLDLWWKKVFSEVRLKRPDGFKENDPESQTRLNRSATLFSLLYYISPWLNRWRGTQLPCEILIGEAGSGKSTLCELRLEILTGQPNLRNAPADLKDWHASIINTGGLHVTDNLQLRDANLRQKLSDEICRLITEPHPHVEMRKYYTNTDLVRLAVDTVFCFTGITQPFPANDLLQRAIIVELDKAATNKNDEIMFDSMWKNKQLERFGGRVGWIAHHLVVLHKFFALVKSEWRHDYLARHRLINVEQALVLMAKLFGIEYRWIPGFINSQTGEHIIEADWSLTGLKAFCDAMIELVPEQHREYSQLMGLTTDMIKLRQFTTKAISIWAASVDDYMDCVVLTNPRKLARYLATHRSAVANAVGLHLIGRYGNRDLFEVREKLK